MQSTMPMVGVRLYPEQAETIRRIAGEKRGNTSLLIRQFIEEGLARMQEERSTVR